MSTSAVPSPPPTDPVITVVSHTGLLYWWPVWLVGFILSGMTWFSGERLAIVPEGTKVEKKSDKLYQLTVPNHPTTSLKEAAARSEDAFPVRISGNRSAGMVFIVVLLIVIF